MQLISLAIFFVFISSTVVDSSPVTKSGKALVGKDKGYYADTLHFYRQQADKNIPKDSAETDSIEIETPKKHAYRLELSGGENSPYASYKFDDRVSRNESMSIFPEVEITTLLPEENITSVGSAKQDMFEEAYNNEKAECSEGELKKLDCNTCVCSDGMFICSKKNCPPKGGIGAQYFEDSFLSHEKLAEQKEEMINSMNMMNNKSWKIRTQSTTPLPDCSSGMTKAIDCNQCICAQQKWSCTKRSCIALTLREKASYTDGTIMKQVDTLKENIRLDEDCLEDESKKMGCNHCVCHYSSWSCTNVSCSGTEAMPMPPKKMQEEIEEACQKEGDVKSKECNLCKCRRGVWVCTMNDCQKLGDKDSPSFRSSSKITKEKDI